jgi:hypothetical protein
MQWWACRAGDDRAVSPEDAIEGEGVEFRLGEG